MDQRVRDVLITTAKEIGEYQLSKSVSLQETLHKGRFDYSTEVDLMSNEIGVQSFRRSGLPYVIVSEEGESPLRLGDSGVLYFDPLEGTHNFYRGRREAGFGVTFGVVEGNQLVYVLFFNVASEEFYEAEQGKGAYVTVKGQKRKLRVSNREERLDIGFNHWPDVAGVGDYLDRLRRLTDSTPTSLSDAVDLACVAGGSLDGLVFVYRRAEPWDMVPALLVEEAGGIATDIRGNSWYRIDPKGFMKVENCLLAGSPEVHARLLELYQGEGFQAEL